MINLDYKCMYIVHTDHDTALLCNILEQYADVMDLVCSYPLVSLHLIYYVEC